MAFVIPACSPQSLGSFDDDTLRDANADATERLDASIDSSIDRDGAMDADAGDWAVQNGDATADSTIEDRIEADTCPGHTDRCPDFVDVVDAGPSDGAADGEPTTNARDAAKNTDAKRDATFAEASSDVYARLDADGADGYPNFDADVADRYPNFDADVADGATEANSTDEPPVEVASWEPQPPNATNLLTATSPCRWGEVCLAGYSDGHIYMAMGSGWMRLDEYQNTDGKFLALPQLAVSSMVISPKDCKRIYVGYSSPQRNATSLLHKVWVSGTGGRSWMELDDSPIDDIWSLSVNPIDPAIVYAVTSNGTYRSKDHGRGLSRTPIPSDPLMEQLYPEAGSGSDPGVSIVAYGRTKDEVWVATESSDVYYRNFAESATWTSIRLPARGQLARLTTRLRGDALPELWAVLVDSREGALWMTDDHGRTWVPKDRPDLPPAGISMSSYVFGISVNPAFPSTFYAIGPGRAWRSDDSGDRWYVPR